MSPLLRLLFETLSISDDILPLNRRTSDKLCPLELPILLPVQQEVTQHFPHRGALSDLRWPSDPRFVLPGFLICGNIAWTAQNPHMTRKIRTAAAYTCIWQQSVSQTGRDYCKTEVIARLFHVENSICYYFVTMTFIECTFNQRYNI